MASVNRGLIAITGANGTIGYACVLYALQTGYRVRCIVRREEAIQAIKSGPSMQEYLSHLEYAVVPDNTVEGAYDCALAGVWYVVHVAGAWPLPNLHPDDDIYHPFMESMKLILQAAEKSGTVRRMVFTQAGAGLVNSEDGDTLGVRMDELLDEHVQVNRESLAFQPPLKSAHNAYCSAKAQCMAYLNNLRLDQSTPFSIVQIIPGTVIGPSEFATTASQAFAHLDRQSKALLFDEAKPRYAFGFVHVRDCARVHVEALDEERVKAEDVPPWFVAGATTPAGYDGVRLWEQVADGLEEELEKEMAEGMFKIGRNKVPVNMPFRVNSKLTEETLFDGGEFKGLADCVKEVGHWYAGLKETT
ncbi:NAD(P)-binding protein [Dothidotthia symphoricarpi CBS 119687]|uniref:NAD(P)-binding protein n=1 Tax=Dothidotthia symphoricarpi CBS 119687 TaxID=1392245 RepID=A0A6A6A5C7_9PLEO|nr:NAD(P)-binding protein [Dothidotthia symphoricarpi CBS 119687]KAF2125978.1 NAD(P)-binding protein [Dothidotthia symphoricarpi CBS 119687]